MGDTDSKVRLGICYHRGEGVAKDETEALSLFLQAAEEGEAYALHNLGYYHEYGRGGIEVNREKAIQYYKMAADEGSRISITTMKEKHGLEYSPPAIKQNNFQVEEEKLMTLQPGDGDEVVCLIADCLSTSELEKLGRFFCSSPVPASQHNDLVRPIAAQILGLLESEGRKHPADGMDAAIVYMLTAAAGLKSADVNTQRRVEGAITALISSLPSLLEECQHNQAVLQGVRPRQRDSDAEENKLALSRAGVVEVMLHRPSSSFSSKFLDDMREKVQSQLSQLKDDLARVESENESRRKAEVAGKGDGWMPSSRDYLLGIQKEGAQFSKVTLPHIVNLSRQLNVDLLSLTDDDLKTALQVKDLGQPVATASDILRFLQKEVNKIEKKEDPSTRMCSTQSLSSFLSGSLPERGAMQDAALASAASHLAKHTRSCSSSAWRSEFEKYWSSLEAIWSAWSELEERIEKALSDKEASLDALRSLLSDLDDSTLFNADLRDKVASRMHALTLAATSSTCMTCGGKPSEVRFFPCRHSCSCLDCALRVLKTAEEKEELGSMGFVSLKGSDTVLSCFQCDRRVLSITQA
uniref:RING-type domain-containing protein n=1 Tax=Palpitomonas bilix TaxID=652834 RepID=A0A7S3GA79_9EUKA